MTIPHLGRVGVALLAVGAGRPAPGAPPVSAAPQAPVCAAAVPAVLAATPESLLAEGRYWHGGRAARVPAGSRTVPAESVLAAALAAEGLGRTDEVEALLRRARGGEGLPAFVALGARADERAERWRDAERKYRHLLSLPSLSDEAQGAAAARLAVVLEQSGQRDSAMIAWRRAALALPLIADWFALRRAELTRDTMVAYAIISGARTPGAVQRAQLYVARRRMAAGDLLGALDVYRRHGRPLDIARVDFDLGRRRAARLRADSVLYAQTTRPDGMLAAVFLTERFDSLTLSETVAIARSYRAHRDLASAERFLRGATRTRDTSVAAWLQLADLLSERRQHVLALRAVDSAGARAGRTRAPLIARARVAALAAADRWPAVDSLVRRLVEVYPGDTNIARAVLLLADRHRLRGEAPAERARYRTLLTRFGDSPAATMARFRLGLLWYADGQLDSAARLIGRALVRDTARTLGAGVRYWEARLRFERGDTAAAAALRRLALEAPTTFYGVRARELLGDSVFVDDTPLPPPPPGSFPPARARERVRLLASVGFDAEARAEATGWALDTMAAVPVLLAAAAAAGDAGLARESILLGEAARARVGMVPGVVRALFPFSYRGVIEAEAREHCVDPLLIAAIVRQESRFDPRAVSRAGARGMSQVMPATAEDMARRMRLGAFEADLLFVPDYNLHLGARYLYDRITRDAFPVHALLASYNAGPARVARWRSWLEFEDPDLFAERVAINETRDYVRTVYASYSWYRQVYAAPAAEVRAPSERPLIPPL